MLPARRRGDVYDQLRGEIDRVFEGFWPRRATAEAPGRVAAYPVDIREEGDDVVIEAELPGFRKDEIDINVEQGVLTINAARQLEEKKGEQHLTERQFTRVYRQLPLPAPVDEEKCEAKLEEGVLTLRMPKREEARARRIEIA